MDQRRRACWRLEALWLPDGTDRVERYLDEDGWHDEPVGAVAALPGGFALAGLVDAHSHVSFGTGEWGPRPLDVPAAADTRDRLARDGVTLLRDVGGDPAVTLRLPMTAGAPAMMAAGRHLAPAGYYFPDVHLPAAPDELVGIALEELAAGAQWVKVVADFISVDALAAGAPDVTVEPTYDVALLEQLITAVHAAGGRVAAHVTTPLVRELVRLGIDSVEHGPALDEDTIVEMAARGTAWTPTLCAMLGHDLPSELRARLGRLLALAEEQGVPILTGSDVVGSVPGEVMHLVECGLSPDAALRAATTTARAFLGPQAAPLPATVVTYDRDPREDPSVLEQPSAVVITGHRVR